MTTPRSLLQQLLDAVVQRDSSLVADLVAPNVQAFVPTASDEPLNRQQLLGWIDDFGSLLGTMRLDLTDVIESTATSVASAVLFTTFTQPPAGSASDREPSWTTAPTIVAANTDPTGRTLVQLFFIIDDPDQADHPILDTLVRNWYTAYAEHDIAGYQAPFDDDAVLWNFSADTDPASIRVQYLDSVAGFEGWIQANTKAGVVVNELAVRGRYVAATVQWLAETRATGQQKMTNEVHVFRCTDTPTIETALFYYTIKCSDPDAVCIW